MDADPKELTYAFVQGPDGRLVPVHGAADENEGPSAEVMLEQFRVERTRARESLERAGSTARSLTRGLRRSTSQQNLRAALGKPPAE
jgi:ferredoxin-NADP reductase